MIDILENTSQRILKTLTILLNNSKTISTKELALQLSVSEKTVQEDLKIIKESWGEEINLQISRNNQIRTSELTTSIFLTIQSNILLNSVPIKLLKSLFYHPTQELSYYAEKLHVSRSTLYRYLPKLNDYLKQYSIMIENKAHCYQLVSTNELGIRRFFCTLFLEISGYDIYYFISKEEIEFFNGRILSIYQINNQYISGLQAHFYTVFYFVSVLREQQGFHLDNSQHFNGIIPPLTDKQNSYFKKNMVPLTLLDLYKIEKSFLILRYSFNNHTNDSLERIIPNFLNNIYSEFNLKKNPEEFNLVLCYFKDLYLSEKYVCIPFHLVNNRFTYFSREIQNDNFKSYSRIKRMVNQLSLQTKVDFNKDLDYIVYILITMLPGILQSTINERIIIVSSYSTQHAHFLYNFFQKQLYFVQNSLNMIQCLSKETFDSLSIINCDLIITNTNLSDYNIDIIKVNDYPSDSDIDSVKERLINNINTSP